MTTQQAAQDHDRYTAALLRIEQAAVAAAITTYLMQLAALKRQARAAAFTRGAEQAAQDLARQLEAQASHMMDERRIVSAVELYAQQATDLAGWWARGPANYTAVEPDPMAVRAMQAAVATTEDKVRLAVKLLEQARTPVAIESALKVVESGAANLATGAEYGVNSAANMAIRVTAAINGGLVLWRAERDCCVVCAALAGHVADPSEGEGFDEFATFDPDRTPPEVWPPGMPLLAPPRHPHCRCFLQTWYGHRGGPLTDLSQVLQREALRSIARGWSLPSESGAARRRAAEHILRTGLANRLPKSVRAEAERGAAGQFTSRHVP